jgi:hypothetical protein
MTRAAVAIVLAAAASLPRTAAACATCISSGFGDRAYSWPYIGLILMPFLVAVGIVVTLAWHAGWRLRDVAGRLAAWRDEQWPRRDGELSPGTNTETT